MADRRIVAIHQPNFFPWLGYFDKLVRADVFVLFDNVQFPRGSGNWINRVRLMLGGVPTWVTVPVLRTDGIQSILDARIDPESPWRRKLATSLRTHYARAAAFDEVFPAITTLLENRADLLADFNAAAVRGLCRVMGLSDDKLVLASSLKTEGHGTDLLISTVKAVGGTAYLAGGGAGGYQEDAKFAEAGLDLVFQQFVHPVYAQFSKTEFVPGLSIIDTLMHCGPVRTAGLLACAKS